MDHTWQQFDSFPKYGGNIHVRHSNPDRGTLYLVVCRLNNDKKGVQFRSTVDKCSTGLQFKEYSTEVQYMRFVLENSACVQYSTVQGRLLGSTGLK